MFVVIVVFLNTTNFMKYDIVSQNSTLFTEINSTQISTSAKKGQIFP